MVFPREHVRLVAPGLNVRIRFASASQHRSDAIPVRRKVEETVLLFL